MIYEKVLAYLSKHNQRPSNYHLTPHENGEATESGDQEISSGRCFVTRCGNGESKSSVSLPNFVVNFCD